MSVGEGEGEVAPLTLADATSALVDHSTISRLLVLDELWSTHLNPSNELRGTDVDGLLALAEEMGRGIDEIPESASRIERLLDRMSVDDVERVRNLMREGLEEQEGIDDWPFGPELSDLSTRDVMIAACTYLREESGAEYGKLRAKIETIQNGGTPGPDLSQPYKCILKIVKAAAGFVVAHVFIALLVGPIALILDVIDKLHLAKELLEFVRDCVAREVRAAIIQYLKVD
ncbi:MAG: hypothetical protein ACHQFZ_02205 [Acidimicrobiales bacterium]